MRWRANPLNGGGGGMRWRANPLNGGGEERGGGDEMES